MKLCKEAKAAIEKGIEESHPITYLEYLGLEQRNINALESSELNIRFLSDLVTLTVDELRTVPNFGEVAVERVKQCLARYHELEQEQERYSYNLTMQRKRLFPQHFNEVER